MRVKKIFCGAVAAIMILFASMSCSAASDESANTKLTKIEIDTYGSEQMGALLDRISRLEKDYNGQNMTGNMNARIDAIWNALYNYGTEPGILAKVNALEWNADHEILSGGINNRLIKLESEILGKTIEGSFNDRIRELSYASYGEEILPLSQVQIPTSTIIKVETIVPVSSKTMQEGDTISVRVVEDVFVDGSLVFAKGLPGEGSVVRVLRAKNIFSNGKIETDFHTLKTIDGQEANVFVGVAALDAMKANEMARGLSLVGQTFSGKNKDLEEVLVRGKNIDLPAGIQLYVEIKKPILVYGVKSEGSATGSLTDDEMNITAPRKPEPTLNTSDGEGEIIVVADDNAPPEPTTSAPPPEPTTSEPPTSQQPPPPANVETPPDSDGEIIEIIDED